MKKLIEKSKNWLSKKPVCYSILGIEFLLIIILFLYWIDIYGWLGLKEAETAESYRNRSFFIAGIIGFILTIIGMGLTIWGRMQRQKDIELNRDQFEFSRESNQNERYENAARKLRDESRTARIAASVALEILGIEEKSMAMRCVNLLLEYIISPYIDENEKAKIREDETDFEAIFPAHKKLRADIQAASNAITSICEHYYIEKESLNLGVANLPSYFLKNSEKEYTSLPKLDMSYKELKNTDFQRVNLYRSNFSFTNFRLADFSHANLSYSNLSNAHLERSYLGFSNLKNSFLQGINLKNADLVGADLVKANLYNADLSGVNLQYAKLSETCLSGAKMSNAKNLTKEQVLSATWLDKTLAKFGAKQRPPELPAELLQDKEIQEWLKDPNYNKKT